ncbi:MAG: hypothetical protein LBE24_01270, partial [Methylobacillus sp.]|nr:hypothetical protein [Methylobacillus sp.]
MGVTPALAQVTIDPNWDGSNYTDATHGQYTYSGGGTETLTGDFTLAPSINPITNISFLTLITNPAADVQGLPLGYTGSFDLNLGGQNDPIIVPNQTNPLLGTETFFMNGSADMSYILQNPSLQTYQSAAASNIYSGLRFATVDNGTLNISINSAALNNAGGTLNTSNTIVAKDTALFMAQNNGTVVLQEDMRVRFAMAGTAVDPTDVVNPRSSNVNNDTFNGSFLGFDGTPWNVTDLASFKDYNDWLADKMIAGELPTAQYLTELNKAYTNATTAFTYDPTLGTPISPGDPLFDPLTKAVIAEANGSNATAIIDTGVTVLLEGDTNVVDAYSSFGAPVAALYASNGGTVINNGLIAGVRGVAPIFVDDNSTGINNGVIIGGSLRTLTNPNTVIATGTSGFVRVDGPGATFTNNGIINVNYQGAIQIYEGSAINNGVINVQNGTSPSGAQTRGINATFTNATGGVIYLGRDISMDMSSPDKLDWGGADIEAASIGSTGIAATAQGGTGINQGKIIIGTKVVGVAGMRATNGSASVINDVGGEIDINGSVAGGLVGVNTGMHIQNTGTTNSSLNAGTINLNAINSVGLYVLATSTAGASSAESSGVINVNGGQDPTTLLRNYGIVAEGSTRAIATLSGVVNLNGDGAIGVHAKNNGQINVIGTGTVVFDPLGTGAINQIGYYALGVNSAITNNSTGTQDVSTDGSTLFRVESGAKFTGGGGASSTFTASGENSVAVAAVGFTGATLSSFNSGGMTINASGINSTAVLIEGGAQGKIESTATINLTGVGAGAGIADGQGHDINGDAAGAPVIGVLGNSTLAAGAAGFGTGTVLVSEANLNSSLDNVTGYIARNGAALDNSGNLNFTGIDTTGISVEDGSTGRNSGTISIGTGGVGISALSSTAAPTTVTNTGTINANGGSVTQRTTGIRASGANATVNMTAGNVNLNGVGSIGVNAEDGATVNLSGTAAVVFNNAASDQIGFLISGLGSTVNNAATSLDASSANSRLFRVDDGASYQGTPGTTLEASGAGAIALVASGVNADSTKSKIDTGDATLDVTGAGAWGVRVDGGAEGIITAGSTINLTGVGAIAGVVDGREVALDGTLSATTAPSTLTNNATVSSAATGATGFITRFDGTLINNGDITLTGPNSRGVEVVDGHFVNTADVTVNGTAVYVEGANATVQNNGSGTILATNGRAAIELGTDADLDLVGSGANTVEGRGTAHAVLIDTDAAGLTVNGAHLIVNAVGATGNGIENAGEIADIQLTNTLIDVANGKGVRTATSLAATNSGTITVTGSGTGLAFETATGTAISEDIDLSDSSGLTIEITGVNGTGISVNHSGGGDFTSAVNVNVAASGGSAVKLTGIATALNSGTLTSLSTAAPVVDASATGTNFTNDVTGIITVASTTDTAVQFGTQNDTFINSGAVTGVVNLGAGTNAAILNAGSTTSQVLGGVGADTVTVKGNAAFALLDGNAGATDTVIFDGATHTLSAASDIDRFETLRLQNSSVVTTALPIKMTDASTNAGGTVNILDTSRLNITAPAGYAFNHALTGDGILSATMANAADAFTFGSGTGSAFDGTVVLGLGTFNLGGVNTAALQNATLQLDAGNVTTVAAGPQSIEGLTFNGGRMNFDDAVPDAIAVTNLVTVDTLTVNSGSAGVQLVNPYTPPAAGSLIGTNLLEQDNTGQLYTQLVAATTVTTPGALLTLFDTNTNTNLSSLETVEIEQSGVNVATGHYGLAGYAGTDGTDTGLFVRWGLTQLDIHAGETLTVGNGNATGEDATLSALVTDLGNLEIDAGTGNTVILTNSGNTYSGNTIVTSGILQLGNNDVLGQTSLLQIEANATVNINGFTQTIGAFDGKANSTLNINTGNLTVGIINGSTGIFTGEAGSFQNIGTGTLTVEEGGTSAGTLTGAATGTFNLNDDFVVTNGGNNGGLASTVNVANGVTATLDHAAGLGNSGTANLNGAGAQLELDFTGAGTLAKTIAGDGTVSLLSAADVTIAAATNNSGFTGTWDIDTGTKLRASTANNLGAAAVVNDGELHINTSTNWQIDNVVTGAGDFYKEGNGTLTAGANLNYSGATFVNQGTFAASADNTFSANSAHTVATGATLDAAGFNQTVASLTNAGTVNVAAGAAGATFTVTGDYVGNGGTVVLGTEWGDDAALHDTLRIEGPNTSGNTNLRVLYRGGDGEATTVGINLVDIVNSSGAANQATF